MVSNLRLGKACETYIITRTENKLVPYYYVLMYGFSYFWPMFNYIIIFFSQKGRQLNCGPTCLFLLCCENILISVFILRVRKDIKCRYGLFYDMHCIFIHIKVSIWTLLFTKMYLQKYFPLSCLWFQSNYTWYWIKAVTLASNRVCVSDENKLFVFTEVFCMTYLMFVYVTEMRSRKFLYKYIARQVNRHWKKLWWLQHFSHHHDF